MKLPDIFASPANVRSVLQGTRIFNAGDDAGEMFVVQSGEVDILINGGVVETIGPDGFFGFDAGRYRERPGVLIA